MSKAVKFPTLYCQTDTGLRRWRIGVFKNTIIVIHGKVDGATQRTEEEITQGKNIGQKNETTPHEQAVAEAKSRYDKMIKKGYVPDKDMAESGQDILEGGIFPMLAHKYHEHGHKLTYPVAVQPKLDGIRCIAIVKRISREDVEISLWTRTRKPITQLPHIESDLAWLGEMVGTGQVLMLDGELYSHRLRTSNQFEKIVAIVKQEKEPHPEHLLCEYHIYDVANPDLPFSIRFNKFAQDVKKADCLNQYIKFVSTDVVYKRDELDGFLTAYLKQGYEGAIVRDLDAKYQVNKRSYGLQKYKQFDDGEFRIVGVEEGRGKMKDHGIFICEMSPGGKQFKAKMEGSMDNLKDYFRNPKHFIGQMLQVSYFGLTGKNGVPRFPVGVRLRNDEDM